MQFGRWPHGGTGHLGVDHVTAVELTKWRLRFTIYDLQLLSCAYDLRFTGVELTKCAYDLRFTGVECAYDLRFTIYRC